MDIQRPEGWEEKKELADYLLDVIEGDPLLRNKFARIIVDIFEDKKNRLMREELYYLIKSELSQDIRRQSTSSGIEEPWWISTD